MAVTVKKIVLWRKDVDNRTGILANALASLANAGTDIHVVMPIAFRARNPRLQLNFTRLQGGSPLPRPTKQDSARHQSRRCWSRTITGRALAMQPRRPLPVRGSTWIFS